MTSLLQLIHIHTPLNCVCQCKYSIELTTPTLKDRWSTYILCSIAGHKKKKICKSVVRSDNCLAKARQLTILLNSLDIFDIRQHYVGDLSV